MEGSKYKVIETKKVQVTENQIIDVPKVIEGEVTKIGSRGAHVMVPRQLLGTKVRIEVI